MGLEVGPDLLSVRLALGAWRNGLQKGKEVIGIARHEHGSLQHDHIGVAAAAEIEFQREAARGILLGVGDAGVGSAHGIAAEHAHGAGEMFGLREGCRFRRRRKAALDALAFAVGDALAGMHATNLLQRIDEILARRGLIRECRDR